MAFESGKDELEKAVTKMRKQYEEGEECSLAMLHNLLGLKTSLRDEYSYWDKDGHFHECVQIVFIGTQIIPIYKN